ncbi:hypothetical protein V8F06_010179 [Rhypophila decipiens]
MTLVNYLITPWAPLVLVAGFLFSYLFPYFVTYRHLRKIPSPFPAQFSDLWLLSVVRRGNRYQRVDELHKKLGPVVRIQPNHVSINDDNAIQTIYGHGNGFLKSYVSSSLSHPHPHSNTNISLPATSTTPSSPSAAASSTRATEPSTPASARSSPTPSRSNQ